MDGDSFLSAIGEVLVDVIFAGDVLRFLMEVCCGGFSLVVVLQGICML